MEKQPKNKELVPKKESVSEKILKLQKEFEIIKKSNDGIEINFDKIEKLEARAYKAKAFKLASEIQSYVYEEAEREHVDIHDLIGFSYPGKAQYEEWINSGAKTPPPSSFDTLDE